MIYTYEQNFKEKAYLVKRTWGKRCNNLLFMSNMTDPNNLIDITVLNVTESRDTLWKKTKLSFQHAYEHHLKDYDWFLKADDDTYVIMENLRYYLYQYPTELPLLFGYQFRRNFMSGGAGYILSREAVRIFNEKALKDKEKCSQSDDGAEDAEMASCLSAFNVTFGDTRDEFLKERFFPLDLDFLLNEEFTDKDFWYYTDAQYVHNETGLECCSNTAIAFHYESPVHMLVFEYLLYHMKKNQIQLKIPDLPKKFSVDDTKIMFPRKNIGLYQKNSSQITANNQIKQNVINLK
ncbi:glycoprotein-N-acetylgalactosamine 3-beta-galactosyltransferase 1-like [Culicoides brevitarsis]|uniref:glycoprotein-N-acetylgalactosamine 3-beta-galactosyltransferase 1-like n=1 Tax=Culicoides brevitarsis TaxID=469753 RepID=UPI00307C4B7C